jgi:hypothetical protein
MQTLQANRRNWLMKLICLWLAVGRLAVFAAEKNPGAAEYQVKAAFLFNFTKFTEWPASAFASSNAPMVIGIVGEDPFGQTLDDAVGGEVVRNHPLVVKRLQTDEDLRSCHVVFISRSEKDRIAKVLEKLKGSAVLTASDTKDFAENGGIVNLLLAQGTVKLEINQTAAEEAGLQISAKLMKLARIVKRR